MKRVLFVSYIEFWYLNRLKPIRQAMDQRGFLTNCILSDFDHIKKTYLIKKESDCRYLHVPNYRKNISFKRIASYLAFGHKVKNEIYEFNPDYIYLVLPPNNIVRYCSAYKKKYPESKLIIDVIDMWPESMPLGIIKKLPFCIWWKKWRDDGIKIADCVFTECELYKKELKGVFDFRKTSTLYLYKEQTLEEEKLIEELIINTNRDDNLLKFAYLGSMNNITDFDGICEVLSLFLLKGYICELHAIGDGENRIYFENLAKQIGCRTFFYGSIFDELEKIKILVPCDYAFNMMKKNITVGLTIKSIDYLSYGLPLINNINGDTWELVKQKRIGINISDLEYPFPTFSHKKVREVFKEKFSLKAFENSYRYALDKMGIKF